MIKEEFKKLASEFQKAELWEDLTDSDVFGVEVEDGRIAYCCVMGNSGIHRGLGIYVGNRGFKTYLDTINKENVNDRKVQFDRMATFNDMQITFDDDGAIHWWSHYPHQIPEPENSTEEELDIMAQALKAAISLRCLIDAEEGDVVSIGFDEYEEYPDKKGGKVVPLVKAEGKGYCCTLTQLPAYDKSDEEQLKQLADTVVSSDKFKADLSLLQALRKAGTLQCRLIHPPTPVRDNDDAPGYYPLWLLTVNKGDGRIIQTEIVELDDELWVYNILSNLCEVMYQQGHMPLQISVPNETTECILKSFCQRQHIKLVRERLPLRELNKAWEGMFSYLERDNKVVFLPN